MEISDSELVTETSLSIGDVHFSIHSEYPIRLSSHIERAHAAFRGLSSAAASSIKFDINLVPDDGDGISKRGALVCETSSWKIYKSGDDGRELIWPRHDRDGNMWRAAIDAERLSATVYVGDEWIEEYNGTRVIKDVVNYPLDELLFMYASAGRDQLLVHSAGCSVYGDVGLVFCGVSGAGKSTISKQLLKDDDFSLISDDRIIIHKRDDVYFMSGTPWPGEAGISDNKTVPLRALFFLKQAEYSSLEPIKAGDAFKQMLPMSTIPWYERELLPGVLDFCEGATAAVPAFNLYFTRDDGVADLLKSKSALRLVTA